jgi:hypothetical protein
MHIRMLILWQHCNGLDRDVLEALGRVDPEPLVQQRQLTSSYEETIG